jgi:death-on-curing protein
VKRRKPIWIAECDVLAIHDRLLAGHGGSPGLRDKGLLQSAVARPLQYHAYADRPDVVEMAMFYTAGIVRNHPFIDGNKRTGFVAGVLFLELNGFIFMASEEDATQAIFGLAGGSLDEAAYTAWLGANSKRGRNR